MSALTLEVANALINGGLRVARERGYRPMAVAVLDESGHIKAIQREDGASMLRVDIAIGKAWAAVGMDTNSRALAQRAKDIPAFFNALAVTGHGKFIAQTGAVLVKSASGSVLGAIGASGGTGDEDEEICIAAILALSLSHG
jgi:uncharacterized protein GlcG (DUF336 family)